MPVLNSLMKVLGTTHAQTSCVAIKTQNGTVTLPVSDVKSFESDFFDELLECVKPNGAGTIVIKLPGLDIEAITCMKERRYGPPPSWANRPILRQSLDAQLDFLAPRPLSRAVVVAKSAAIDAVTKFCAGTYAYIEPGESFLGSPAHEAGRRYNEEQAVARITRPYWLKRDRVTQREFKEVMGFNPSHFITDPPDGLADDCPVENVTWFHALAYCNALSIKEGLRPCYDLGTWSGRADEGDYPGRHVVGECIRIRASTGRNVTCDWSANGYRLPTRAEWVRAARAGTRGPTYAAAGQPLGDIAWCGQSRTRPVGREMRNAFGIRPFGNVHVWLWDQGTLSEPPGGDDPKGPNHGWDRVYTGGSWAHSHATARATFSRWLSPRDRRPCIGLCPARAADLDPQAARRQR